jgi:Spy/CpxP family protein refolding chaperone
MRALDSCLFVCALLVLLTGTAAAQQAPTQPAEIHNYEPLLQNGQVQKELKLTEEQRTKIREIIRTIRLKHREELERIQNLPAEEKGAKFREELQKISQETLTEGKAALKPEQVLRLKQIMTQLDGIEAFSEPKVEKELKLSESQKQKIKDIEEDLKDQVRQAFQGKSRTTFTETMKKMQVLRTEAVNKAVAVLDPAQKKTWKELVAEPFELKTQGGPFRQQ